MINHEDLNRDSLLEVEVKDDELSELLERLAATDAMFRTPVSTIRDVSEVTDASPKLIARILGEMRGPTDIENLTGRLDAYERRLLAVEQRRTYTVPPLVKPAPVPIQTVSDPVQTVSNPVQDEHWKTYNRWLKNRDQEGYNTTIDQNEVHTRIIGFILFMIAIFFFAIMLAVNSGNR